MAHPRTISPGRIIIYLYRYYHIIIILYYCDIIIDIIISNYSEKKHFASEYKLKMYIDIQCGKIFKNIIFLTYIYFC